MTQILKSLLRDTPIYVPYTMRYKFPEGYAKALQYQTHQITSNRTIVLQHISESAMYYLDNHIKAIDGVKDMLPAKDVTISGRHNILVDKNEFQMIRSHLLSVIEKWHNDFVEVDALPPEGYYPGPPRVKPIADDGISSGENSWMSMSNASFMSMDLSMVQSDDYFATNHTANQTFSYAEVVLTNKDPSSKNMKGTQFDEEEQKDTFSDITGTRTSTTDTIFKREMERLQAAKDKEFQETRAVIAEQQREIQQMKENHLKELVAQQTIVDEVRKQHAKTQEDMDNRLYLMQQQLRIEMAHMMEQMVHTSLRNIIPKDVETQQQQSHVKRPNNTVNSIDDAERNEKRQDNRKSPIKKQLNYKTATQHHEDSLNKQAETSAMDEDDNASISES